MCPRLSCLLADAAAPNAEAIEGSWKPTETQQATTGIT